MNVVDEKATTVHLAGYLHASIYQRFERARLERLVAPVLDGELRAIGRLEHEPGGLGFRTPVHDLPLEAALHPRHGHLTSVARLRPGDMCAGQSRLLGGPATPGSSATARARTR